MNWTALCSGYLLDLIFGDPYWMPHPVRYIGKLISILEKMLWKQGGGKELRLRGTVLTAAVVSLTFAFYSLAMRGAYALDYKLGWAIEAFMIYQVFATRCLANEALKVRNFLKADDLSAARKQISYLVSRDVDSMDQEDITKAAVETVSENLLDGVIAPLFYLVIGGLPLGMAYKAANTLDSMVGYKNDRYQDFGWASARFDDLLNWVPARITGLLIVAAAFLCRMDTKRAWKVLIRDRRNHSSPNSPYAEAPAAGALNIQLGGKATYFGVTSMKPTMGDPVHPPTYKDIDRSVVLMVATSALGLALMIGSRFALI